MNIFNEIIGNRIIVAGFLGWLIAQILKTIIHMIVHRSFNPERIVGSGGMPSSHSSTVCAIAGTAFFLYGAGSFEFAIALFFAIIVMHDARGVRRETGNQAVIINEMMDYMKMFSPDITFEDKLKEFVGHTPLQVFVGAVLGVVISIFLTL